jgi:hypothetical protein
MENINPTIQQQRYAMLADICRLIFFAMAFTTGIAMAASPNMTVSIIIGIVMGVLYFPRSYFQSLSKGTEKRDATIKATIRSIIMGSAFFSFAVIATKYIIPFMKEIFDRT